MKKKSLVCGLIPALALGMCSTGFAATDAAAPASEDDWKAIEELRAQLEADLQQAAEMEERLNAQLDSLDKRVTKVEKEAENPRIEFHGNVRLRHEKHNFEQYKAIDRNTIRLNLFTDYKISDGVVIKSEGEFENNLTSNYGAYEGDSGYAWDRGGKQYDRVIKQLYVDGKVKDLEIKLGRYHLESPKKLTFEDEVDGIQFNYDIPTKFGKANVKFSAGNTGNTYNKNNILYADPEIKDSSDNRVWWNNDDNRNQYKMVSLMADVPVADGIDVFAHYGKVTHRHSDYNNASRRVFSYGFDAKIAPDLKFTVATANSSSKNYSKSHIFQLQYKDVDTTKPGSYSVSLKKYILRGHTHLTRWFMDDISVGTDFADQIDNENKDSKVWDTSRAATFNGLRIGAEYVPLKNTLLSVDYTFGDFGTFNWGEYNLNGKKQSYSLLSAKMQFFF